MLRARMARTFEILHSGTLPMSTASGVSRRQFLSCSAAALGVPVLLSSRAQARTRRPVASERVTVGLIGLGAQGFDNLRQFLRLADVQVMAVCDVDPLHYRDNAWGQGLPYGREPAKEAVERHYAGQQKSGTYTGCTTLADFRDLCARPDLDAVVISTPDHWHALCALEAMRQGKDIYCEKPVTHFFREGELLVEEVSRRQAVFQTGSQQRSMPVFRLAVEIVPTDIWERLRRSRSACLTATISQWGTRQSRRRRNAWTTSYGPDRRRSCRTCGPGIIAGGAGIGPMGAGH